jgi:adenylosuccinate lyase
MFIKWVPCHHGMTSPQVADGGNALQIWRVATNILNKQSRTADKGWASSFGVGRRANNSSP